MFSGSAFSRFVFSRFAFSRSAFSRSMFSRSVVQLGEFAISHAIFPGNDRLRDKVGGC